MLQLAGCSASELTSAGSSHFLNLLLLLPQYASTASHASHPIEILHADIYEGSAGCWNRLLQQCLPRSRWRPRPKQRAQQAVPWGVSPMRLLQQKAAAASKPALCSRAPPVVQQTAALLRSGGSAKSHSLAVQQLAPVLHTSCILHVRSRQCN